jgi:chaperonin GroES
MRVVPYGERVLIKREAVETKTAGGIILQTESQERPVQGLVKGVGAGVEGISVGDTVIFGKYASSATVDVEGQTLEVIDTSEVKAVIIG